MTELAVALIEHTVMSNLRREYESLGYDFYENPPAEAVPSFLGKFQPDAIAVRGNEGVVLELRPRSTDPSALNYIAERFEGQSRWRFRVIFYDQNEELDEVGEAENINVQELRSRVQKLRDGGEVDAALLLAWAALEAVFRAKSKPSISRYVRSPQQIAERLEHLGIVEGEKANLLRQSAAMRNSVAHGRFELRPGTGLIDVVLELADVLDNRRTKID